MGTFRSEKEARHIVKESTDNLAEVITQLSNEETALKVQKAKVNHENPFAKEMETNQQEYTELQAHKAQVEAEAKEQAMRIETLRQDAEKALKIAELEYQHLWWIQESRRLMWRLKSKNSVPSWKRVKARLPSGWTKTRRDGKITSERWWTRKVPI